jgi:lipopolysaccharide biosynthesis regulator YciM
MLELLFLLLPVAAFYGYVMGARSARKSNETKQSSNLGNIIKGINYFLNKDSDKASDELVKYLNKTKDHTFEEQIALGNIFREKGEFDKAIKFHQSLMVKEELEPVQRSFILLELSKDFLRVGLLNKAEEILYELISYDSQKKSAVLLLVNIYEQEKDFTKALKLIDSYRKFIPEKLKIQEAQFFCELANDEYTHKNYQKSLDLFKKAASANPKCFRAYFTSAKIYIELEKFNQAIEAIENAQEADVTMQDVLVKHLKKCFKSLNDPKLFSILNAWLEKSYSIEVILSIAEIYNITQNKDAAEDFLIRILKTEPNLKLLAQFLEYRLSDLDIKSQERLSILKNLIESYQVKAPRFVCEKCGFTSSILFWQCPGCHAWESMKPTNTINTK